MIYLVFIGGWLLGVACSLIWTYDYYERKAISAHAYGYMRGYRAHQLGHKLGDGLFKEDK